MAIMKLSSRMVYWKIKVNAIDISEELAPYVESIRIRTSTAPPPKRSKKGYVPTQAEISITSKNYIENFFVAGQKIDIYIGYDKIGLTHVFSGLVLSLPTGMAREMLQYTVIAGSSETQMALEEKNRTFEGGIKKNIVKQIAEENGYAITYISIKDEKPLPAKVMAIQKKETDYQFLARCAKEWGCEMWFPILSSNKKVLCFVDADVATTAKYVNAIKASVDSAEAFNRFTYTYNLGYRTDNPRVTNNVESISWAHESPEAKGDGIIGSLGLNELGTQIAKGRWEGINEKRQKVVWVLKPDLGDITKEMIQLYLGTFVVKDNFEAIRLFYNQERVLENARSEDNGPADEGSGFKITIKLNEGDPTVFPPLNCFFTCGSINPRADSSHLPKWMFAEAKDTGKYETHIKIKEHILSFENGILRSEFSCSIGVLQ